MPSRKRRRSVDSAVFQKDFADESGEFAENLAPADDPADAIDVEFTGSQLELMQPLGQLDQRRTIVSVRLTEGEFACLRDRAEESGISVSAYMRSCVVDAEQLRSQVKRALAEMRSLSAPGGPGQIAALNPSSPKSRHLTAWNGGGWFRLAMRPLALLFGPLFPHRPHA